MSESIPVICPCGFDYDAGENLACPSCGVPSARATLGTHPASGSDVLLKTCVCGRHYNQARLAACPACGKATENWRPKNAGSSAIQRNQRGDEDRSRKRRNIMWGVVAIVVVLVPVVIIFGSRSDNSDMRLTATLVKETLEDREIPCDDAEVKSGGGPFDYLTTFDSITTYECVVAGESFVFVIYNPDSGNAQAAAIDRACSLNIPFTYLVGTNWRARTSTPLVGFGVLQDAFGGILTTNKDLCPIVQRTFYPNDFYRSQWIAILNQLQRETGTR